MIDMFGGWKEMQRLVDMSRIVDSLMFEGLERSFATDGTEAGDHDDAALRQTADDSERVCI
jgi:hypothetical protein